MNAELLRERRRIHLMGIGGAGMSGLAEWLIDRGHDVSGCDSRASAVTDRLERLGARIRIGHDPAHLDDVDALVVSSAIGREEQERRVADERGIPVIRRAELLGAVMARGRGIAIAGTHGKSTTTAMTGSVLAAGGLDPTVIVGGRIRGLDGNVRIGSGEWIVVEADEFDRSFLALAPEIAVITNVEADHLDVYGTIEAVREAFAEFARRVRPGGLLALGGDDPGARAVPVPEGVEMAVFGTQAGVGAGAGAIAMEGPGVAFDLELDGRDVGRVRLAMPGIHNVRNALAAAAVGRRLNVDPDAIRRGLEAVRGVERRFEILHETADLVIVDDYAHHPSEIAATLGAARERWPDRRLVALFQPHLYSRTRDFALEFGGALARADLVFVTDVYAAREAPLPGVTGRLVVDAAMHAGAAVRFLAEGAGAGEPAEAVEASLAAGDVVVTLGAGDIDALARRLAARAGARGGTGVGARA